MAIALLYHEAHAHPTFIGVSQVFVVSGQKKWITGTDGVFLFLLSLL
jgi:hypothetical protein